MQRQDPAPEQRRTPTLHVIHRPQKPRSPSPEAVESPRLSGGSPSSKHGLSFKVLQVLTGTDDDEGVEPPPTSDGKGKSRFNSQDDEMTFSGINKREEVPSHTFKRLMRMTSKDELETQGLQRPAPTAANIKVRAPVKEQPQPTHINPAAQVYTPQEPVNVPPPVPQHVVYNAPAPASPVMYSPPQQNSGMVSPPVTVKTMTPGRVGTPPGRRPGSPTTQSYAISPLAAASPPSPTQQYYNIAPMPVSVPVSVPIQHYEDDDAYEGPIGKYDETSIRYKGRNIPSKSFKLLQQMTGGPDTVFLDPAPSQQQTRRRARGSPEAGTRNIQIMHISSNQPPPPQLAPQQFSIQIQRGTPSQSPGTPPGGRQRPKLSKLPESIKRASFDEDLPPSSPPPHGWESRAMRILQLAERKKATAFDGSSDL
ncbi:extensin-like [Lingula anatina]|uniref:Extensin-like n=1 Tax=Lingula anatina TaxID=7574 RepID=A0A1S3HBM1_LINAN|nr:extensin-like [Lingula anatina]|eukprot:XP_013382524.1 extensin-like [Lingula anatina]